MIRDVEMQRTKPRNLFFFSSFSLEINYNKTLIRYYASDIYLILCINLIIIIIKPTRRRFKFDLQI